MFILTHIFLILSVKANVECHCTGVDSSGIKCDCSGNSNKIIHHHGGNHHLGVYCELNNNGVCISDLKERNYCHCTGEKNCACDEHDFSNIRQYYCRNIQGTNQYTCSEHENDDLPIKNYNWVDFICVDPHYYRHHMLSEDGGLWYNEHTRLLNLCHPTCATDDVCAVRIKCHHGDRLEIKRGSHGITDEVHCVGQHHVH